ncbi:PAAR-like protein [Pedobacter nototheniae]|uniref:PAAR-like protein n=1 Tax=Pedobacter nototheniae TaxID=2488994 RepID=UPI002931BFA6|nr:PAAR-like protein [Pedobacter nototheniae]
MKKAILPSKVYLVCSSGMMKSELVVYSQGTVFNDDKNRLIATKDDRFGDFMCKYALILGALVAGAMVASGGSLAAILLTIVVATGISLSMCAIVNFFNGGGWKKIHPTTYVEKKNVLTDKSYFSCPIGGTIIPIYDKNIASQQAAIFRNKAATEIAMSFIGGWMLGGYGAYCVTAQVGFGGYMAGIGTGYVLNVGVNELQDFAKESVNGKMNDNLKDSPLYNEGIYGASNDLGYYAPKMSGDENSVRTGVDAKEIHNNREEIIRKGTESAQSQRVNPNEGSLNNPLNKNKFKTQENQIKATYGKHNYRRSQEWKNLQNEKASYNRNLGQKELNAKHSDNLKKGAKGFKDGFNPKTPAGGLFWAGTIFETISNIVVEREQRRLLESSINPESIAKEKLGVFAIKI